MNSLTRPATITRIPPIQKSAESTIKIKNVETLHSTINQIMHLEKNDPLNPEKNNLHEVIGDVYVRHLCSTSSKQKALKAEGTQGALVNNPSEAGKIWSDRYFFNPESRKELLSQLLSVIWKK